MAQQTLHRGRLIDHVHLRVADLGASKRFYRAVLATLGREADKRERAAHLVRRTLDRRGRRGRAKPRAPRLPGERPRRRWRASTKRGSRPAGATTARRASATYHPGYYAAFLLDPDGHNIEAVHHGPAERSAESVEISFGG